jgi:hypothetical protein
MNELNTLAGDELIIFVTRSLRRPGQLVSGAIVQPAKFSNHHVGHGIDFNLIYGNEW